MEGACFKATAARFAGGFDAAEFESSSFVPQMTWNSTMSSGYSSLEEDSEEYFFTARTSFFKKPQGKVTENKVNTSGNGGFSRYNSILCNTILLI